MYPVWRDLEVEGYKVRWIDVDASQEDERNGVAVIPTTIIYKNGKEVAREVGVVPKAWIKRHL